MDVSMGGVRLLLRLHDPEMAAACESRLGRFNCPAADGPAPGLPLDLSVALSERAGDPALRDLRVRCDGDLVYAARSDLDGTIDVAAGRGRVSIFPTDHTDVSLEAFLRLAVSLWAPRNGGILLHSAAVVVDGRGYAFVGRSGAGKSTLARLALACGLTVLTDEIALVRRVNGRWWIAGTPFSGEVTEAASPDAAPLAAVALLRKSTQMRVARPRQGSEMRQLMRSILMFGAPVSLMSDLLKAALLILNEVSLKVMHFRPEAAVWEMIDDLA